MAIKTKSVGFSVKGRRKLVKKENWVARLKKKVKAQLKKDKSTVRTKTITGQLQQAGLSEKDIKRLKGKK